ncbi:hypothetical protein [Sphingomonas rubra]|uniref:DUF4276 family protein n=1 Tax=Sphingomonas rubra TaxID=634430 RepID=A0A1I5SPR7_9SPHN|nr:hypothetical protein [Sphingomonas rubra]SFP72792.1 hypothetical protein SAMN04488241_10651 [Sphingomonas rubra]
MQPIVAALIGPCETIARRHRELVTFPGKQGGLPGQARKAALARVMADGLQCSALIYATDADSNDPAERAMVVAEVEAGLASIDNDVAAVACVPMGTSEAWLLADEAAWQGVGLRDGRALPAASPETLWGRPRDQAGQHPKVVFERVCASANIEADMAIRRDIAHLSDLDTIGRRCPVSFPPFAAAVRALIAP